MDPTPLRAVLGALVGDAAGATLEFYHAPDGSERITEAVARHAMTMPGGGALRVGPGQITDDGELTLACWSTLHLTFSMDARPIYPSLPMAAAYAAWYDSIPFDIGRTCSLAFDTLSDMMQTSKNPVEALEEAKAIIRSMSMGSEANGAMMRATPIAAACTLHGISAEHAATMAMSDATLSHPGLVAQHANAVYVYLLCQLLHGHSPNAALQHLETYMHAHAIHPTVQQWVLIDSTTDDFTSIAAHRQIGHVRWGLTMAVWFLRHPDMDYETAVCMTLQRGGDTDTNACIVGGMVACYQPVPGYMRDPVMRFDATREQDRGHLRPVMYSVRHHLLDMI